MTDNKSKRDYRDRDRINQSEPYEVGYWAKELGVSKQRLREAIDRVGPMVADVRHELGK